MTVSEGTAKAWLLVGFGYYLVTATVNTATCKLSLSNWPYNQIKERIILNLTRNIKSVVTCCEQRPCRIYSPVWLAGFVIPDCLHHIGQAPVWRPVAEAAPVFFKKT